MTLAFRPFLVGHLALGLLTAGPAETGSHTKAPHFTAADAVKAEWERQLPSLSEMEVTKLSKPDRERFERARMRIGMPGSPDLLPAELAHPTLDLWEQKAKEARTPQDRFTALFFLNRLKNAKALDALAGLTEADAKGWPKLLHLEHPIAAARLNGAEVSPGLQGFLQGLQKAGKVDPTRAQAARLRLVLAGKEKELLPNIVATPGSILSIVDAWNRAPKPADFRWTQSLDAFANRHPVQHPAFPHGLKWNQTSEALETLMWVRLAEGKPKALGLSLAPHFEGHWSQASTPPFRFWTLPILGAFPKPWALGKAQSLASSLGDLDRGYLLPVLRNLDPTQADAMRSALLSCTTPTARSAAIEDLPSAPEDLDALASRCFKDADLESALTLFQALDRWKLPPERQKALLTPFLQHTDWGWRCQAYLQLKKIDPSTPWPAAPAPRPEDAALLKEAQRLATLAKPVRLRITFSGARKVTLRLDPTVAPINVANLKRLAERKFFDGRLVPRVVPDFVVQMGSPLDTMDGGPGYSVRCENSLTWYGPGSVGMALSGKDTGGCQFFLTTNATPHLTGKYTRLGEVEDLENAMKILDDLELGAKIQSIRVLP